MSNTATMPALDDPLVKVMRRALVKNRTGVDPWRRTRAARPGPICPRCLGMWLHCPHPAAVLGRKYAAP
jgi:hypothetical protein